MTVKLLLCCGLPGSGKTTYAQNLQLKEPGKWIRVNRDTLREMLYNNKNVNEEMIRKHRDHLISDALKSGHNVVCDDTNLVSRTVRKIHKLAQAIGDVIVWEKPFNLSIDECKARNALRQGYAKVPETVIDSMARKSGLTKGHVLQEKEVYYPPKPPVVVYTPDLSKPLAIVCDIDGTLADGSHRSPYDGSKVLADKPIEHVIEMVRNYEKLGYTIMFCSGREDSCQEDTRLWLSTHVTSKDFQLHMRKTRDSRKDSIVKQEIFDSHLRLNYNVRAWIDDRLQVVQMVHALGLPLFRVGDPEANF